MNHSITVVSLGPGDPELLTVAAEKQLLSHNTLILRTSRHPVSAWLGGKEVPYTSLDFVYDEFDDFDIINQAIVDNILHISETSPVVYGVPDPVTDLSVSLLSKQCHERDINFIIIPGVSYANASMLSHGIRDSGGNIRISTASSLVEHGYDPEIPLLITEIDNQILAGEVKNYLSLYHADEYPVIFYDISCNRFKEIPLFETDRQERYLHTTTLYVGPSSYTERDRYTFRDLELIMKRLRQPHGCPWDREQTHASLCPYLVEEAWEAVSTIDENDMDHLSDELGDVLFQVVFHTSIAEDFSEFTMTDVITNICSKMIQRHPHVFGKLSVSGAEEVSAKWETIKRKETGSKSVGQSMDDVAASLPALKYAIKVFKKANQWDSFHRTPMAIADEIQSLSGNVLQSSLTINEEIMGSLLMKCTQLCQICGVDSEILLHKSAEKFKKRFQALEKKIILDGKSPESLTFQQLCVYLSYVKDEIE